ncbi:MAG: serine dehydratase subunit alpha family protein, partial [Oscillospiraceae bacterium]|nr:serine dehydratase subunit alpha family protein [Oscillospiraceae bacterium]
ESQSGALFDIHIVLTGNHQQAVCRIAGEHTNIVHISVNGETVLEKNAEEAKGESAEKELLSVEDIVAFADIVEIKDVQAILDRQIQCNMDIAREGLAHNYGARIGQVLLNTRGNDVVTRAKAYAAAASDARMGGCEMPVVINSGSGNQGITASVPVVIYARELNTSRELLYRSLVVSNLVTLHLKSGIGPLSAYCGAISAGCGAAAGITYLYGGKFREVAHTIVNAIAINSGVICDGAKASCAAKIASAVEAGILGMEMFRQGSQFLGGDGIVRKGVENTIDNVSRLASEGMRKTDAEIIKIMLS